MLVLYAVAAIPANAEITISYLSEGEQPKSVQDHLKKRFNFLCVCSACTRPSQERLQSQQRIREYIAFAEELPFSICHDPPLPLLQLLEHMTRIACEEGLTRELGLRCYDAFHLCALNGDHASAVLWAELYRDAYVLSRGKDTHRAKEGARLARNPTIWRDWGKLGSHVLRGPVSDGSAHQK